MSGEKRWMPTTFMPTMLLPERWAEDTLPPSERGPWASITCGDIETRDEVLAALRAASSDLAVTVTLEDGTEVLVRRYADGTIEADVRGGADGRRSWTPVSLVGGSFRVEHLEPSR